jgi:hypothetical protein
MHTKHYLFLTLAGQLFLTASVQADTRFIIDTEEDLNYLTVPNNLDDGIRACKKLGFSILASTCTGVNIPGRICPYNNLYTDECCNGKYRYVINSACHHNATPSSDLCGERFACICNPTIYPKGIDREQCTGKFSYDEIVKNDTHIILKSINCMMENQYDDEEDNLIETIKIDYITIDNNYNNYTINYGKTKNDDICILNAFKIVINKARARFDY